jgi:hypothetical protein
MPDLILHPEKPSSRTRLDSAEGFTSCPIFAEMTEQKNQ